MFVFVYFLLLFFFDGKEEKKRTISVFILPKQICCFFPSPKTHFPFTVHIFQYCEWQIASLFSRHLFHFSNVIVFSKATGAWLSLRIQPDPSFMANLWINLSGFCCYCYSCSYSCCWSALFNARTLSKPEKIIRNEFAHTHCNLRRTQAVKVYSKQKHCLRWI